MNTISEKLEMNKRDHIDYQDVIEDEYTHLEALKDDIKNKYYQLNKLENNSKNELLLLNKMVILVKFN